MNNRVFILFCVCIGAFTASAQNMELLTNRLSGRTEFVAYAEKVYQTTRTRYLADTNNAEAGWQFARACFERAEYPTNSNHRAALAEEGIAVGRFLVRQYPKMAAGHYYLGMNLAQWARTKYWGALKIVGEMERSYLTAIALDPLFDEAGAHRYLGLLYRDAPGWPISIGSRSKAREHLRKMVELCPDFPDNRLFLMESYFGWGEKKAALADMESVQKALDKARPRLTGEAWAASWADWDERWKDIKRKAAQAERPDNASKLLSK